MGSIRKKGSHYLYQQDNGDVTARFDAIEEKRVLAHAGTPLYRRLIVLLVLAAGGYLTLVFVLFK